MSKMHFAYCNVRGSEEVIRAAVRSFGELSSLHRRLDARTEVDPISGCWIWKGYTDRRGYGHIGFGKTLMLAHRASYERHKGSIPKDSELDHLCRIPSCINPVHLEPVSHIENCRRGIGAEVHRLKAKRRTHCRRGHLKAPSDTYVDTRGKQSCKICRRESARLMRQKIGSGYAPLRSAYRVGTACHLAKLDVNSVRRIKALLADGFTSREIGPLFGLHESSVRAIKTGKSWRHVN